MAPGNEFARDLCAGIGPLQLGVVLIIIITRCPINNYGLAVIVKSVSSEVESIHSNGI